MLRPSSWSMSGAGVEHSVWVERLTLGVRTRNWLWLQVRWRGVACICPTPSPWTQSLSRWRAGVELRWVRRGRGAGAALLVRLGGPQWCCRCWLIITATFVFFSGLNSTVYSFRGLQSQWSLGRKEIRDFV